MAALMVAGAVVIALIEQAADDLVFTVGIAAFSIFVPVATGVLWWRRRPEWLTGTLLVTLGGLTASYTLINTDQPLLYAVGLASEALAIGLVFFLLIAFPEGRLADRHSRALLALAMTALAILYVPMLIASPEPRSIFPAYDCAPCPANPVAFFTMSEATLDSLVTFGSLLLAGAALALTVEFVRRAMAARGPRRRMLVTVAATSLLLMPALAVYLFGKVVLAPGDELLALITAAVVVLWFAYPLGLALPFAGEDVAAASTLTNLLGDLSEPRRRDRWRDRLAAALDDPQLEVGFWDEQSGSYINRDGNVMKRDTVPAERVWIDIEGSGRPLAAMVVDPDLGASPEVTTAAGLATAAAVDADRIEATRRELLGRAATAAVAERSRMARTVQAGAHQRLAAMRVAVNMAVEHNAQEPRDGFLSLVAAELDAAIRELREIVWADGSATVSRRGLGASLRSVTRAAPTTVRVLDRGLPRSHPQTELAVYYCCLEALQNAIKHAGRDVPVTIRLSEAPQGGIAFSVIDTGAGFRQEEETAGVGLRTMHDRVEALGGWLRVTSAPGLGTVVSGWVPSRPRPLETQE